MQTNPKSLGSLVNFKGKTVLITGGTRGIGLETALSFAKLGAKCYLTYRWGDHDEVEICKEFAAVGASDPVFIQADVSNEEDTMNLLNLIKEKSNFIDIFISNVSVSTVIKSFEDYSLKGLKQSISYSSWPLVAYTMKIKEVFNTYPRYIIGVSSTGPDHYSYGYDFVAASKTVLEVLCRYLNYRLKEENVAVNIVRSRAIKTKSLENTFGNELEAFMKNLVPDNYWIEPIEVANAIVGLCSGYCDAIRGQTINVDRGTRFFDNYMDIYTRHLHTNSPNI
jgi:NAD(P)-dependent dehydrogenase (short-subunit alcohol dehydrogenase family)